LHACKPANKPALSVVVASKVGPPFIDDCLASLEAQAGALGADVIVVACGTEAHARRLRDRFPWVKVLHHAPREGIPTLRRVGVERASGDIIATIEEHCLAAPDWLHQALRAHRQGDYAAVGGPVCDHAYARLRDWAVYFCEYNGDLPPARQGEVGHLNAANVAYRRRALLEQPHLLGDSFWAVPVDPALATRGVKFLSVPAMLVYHRGPFPFGYYLRQRFCFSRAYAGARALTLPAWRRLAYLVAAPLVPGLLLARMALRVWRKRCHVGQFVRSLPLLLSVLPVYVAGEWLGYVAGPGDALAKVE
jgi:glycosyltransferase involved in cell wall biosynthesis